jgi:hypothetical protein
MWDDEEGAAALAAAIKAKTEPPTATANGWNSSVHAQRTASALAGIACALTRPKSSVRQAPTQALAGLEAAARLAFGEEL